MDVAGTVIEVGDGVTDVQVGDRVVVDPSLAGVDDDSEARRAWVTCTASSE